MSHSLPPKSSLPPDETPENRRAFFDQALKELMSPLASVIDGKLGPILAALDQIPDMLPSPPSSSSPSTPVRIPLDQPHVFPLEDAAITPPSDGHSADPVQPSLCGEGKMGLAKVEQDLCRRSVGDDCRACVESCPLGDKAIILSQHTGRVVVKVKGCTGCAICEQACPTLPQAIRVQPLGPASEPLIA